MRLYASGVAAYLRTIENLLFTQAVLDQAVSPKEARQQVKWFLDFIQDLGALALEPHYYDKSFRYNIRLVPAPGADKGASK